MAEAPVRTSNGQREVSASEPNKVEDSAVLYDIHSFSTTDRKEDPGISKQSLDEGWLARLLVGTRQVDIRRKVKAWIQSSNSLRIFVFGKIGAGKSTLINSLLRIYEAKVGSGLSAVTKSVRRYKGVLDECLVLPELQLTIHGVSITLWDSPGLQDTDKTKDIIGDITETCNENELDLYIYCVNMTQIRIDAGEFASIKALTEALGEDFWRHSFFALTHANAVEVPLRSVEKLEYFFAARLEEWKLNLRKGLSRAEVSESIVKAIPVVPCSYRNLPLPVSIRGANWFATFWETCVVRMRFRSIPALLAIHDEYIDGSMEAITERFVDYAKAKEHFEPIASLLEVCTPEEASHHVVDGVKDQERRRRRNTVLLFLWSCVTTAAIAAMST